MAAKTPRGCLLQAAVAADPGSASLRNLLKRHKSDVSTRAAEAWDPTDAATELLIIDEGLTSA